MRLRDDQQHLVAPAAFTVAVKGTSDAPTEVHLIVELLGGARPEFKDWAQLDPKRRGELERRFQRFGFVKRMPDPSPLAKDPVPPWLDDQWAKILQAIEKIPDEILAAVTGIAWERAGGPAPIKGGSATTRPRSA